MDYVIQKLIMQLKKRQIFELCNLKAIYEFKKKKFKLNNPKYCIDIF